MAERTKSWLSPKRRRTTGNLKTLGGSKALAQEEGAARPTTPTRMDRPISERPTSPRPLSPPSVPSSNGSVREGEGNLFYAYARKVCHRGPTLLKPWLITPLQGDDLSSRYLLTFASASVANEWYSLIKSHFPSTTRPGPQLFSFKTDDLLPKAWRHPAFEHLQSKWMYISFSETSSESIGGAAQGIIPVQDVHGNMLGGAASPSSSPEIGKARKEVRDMNEGVGRLEEHFEKMMEAVERNTEGVRKLAEERQEYREDGHGRGSVDKSELSGHIARMADVLERNTEYIDTMSKRKNEQDERLIRALESVNSRQVEDHSDISKLVSHLNRIHDMMEHSEQQRRDSVRPVDDNPPGIDFSPLTERMEQMQAALEQNSSFMRQLLERDTAGKAKPEKLVDFRPLTAKLDMLQDTTKENARFLEQMVDAQNAAREATVSSTEQMKELVEAQKHTPSRAGGSEEFDLTPLTERLNRIHASLEKPNSPASPGSGDPRFVLNALTSHLSKIQAVTEQNANAIKTISVSNTASNDALQHNLEALRKQSARTDSKQLRLDERRGIDMETVDKRLEATNSQVRELMAGHREMTKVMRELAEAITAQNKGSCDHVVIPPPRKVGRKIVGFVYDGKEGTI